eukprot:TRINITY_DN5017_c0_g1_i1.p1 TRINITY_DN5017_c0_g1~~TRINITY_DN5017_c0_g1_i1.p1  ORF type:complete len:802 (-),score=168.99 TRINITY_DN5017_c0_g1_i1:63-2468(-)
MSDNTLPSTETIVAISVGASVLVLAILGFLLGYCLWKRRSLPGNDVSLVGSKSHYYGSFGEKEDEPLVSLDSESSQTGIEVDAPASTKQTNTEQRTRKPRSEGIPRRSKRRVSKGKQATDEVQSPTADLAVPRPKRRASKSSTDSVGSVGSVGSAGSTGSSSSLSAGEHPYQHHNPFIVPQNPFIAQPVPAQSSEPKFNLPAPVYELNQEGKYVRVPVSRSNPSSPRNERATPIPIAASSSASLTFSGSSSSAFSGSSSSSFSGPSSSSSFSGPSSNPFSGPSSSPLSSASLPSLTLSPPPVPYEFDFGSDCEITDYQEGDCLISLDESEDADYKVPGFYTDSASSYSYSEPNTPSHSEPTTPRSGNSPPVPPKLTNSRHLRRPSVSSADSNGSAASSSSLRADNADPSFDHVPKFEDSPESVRNSNEEQSSSPNPTTKKKSNPRTKIGRSLTNKFRKSAGYTLETLGMDGPVHVEVDRSLEVLESMKPKTFNNEKRIMIAKEILATEKNYFNGLCYLTDFLAKPLLASEIVDKEFVDAVFPPSLETIKLISDTLLRKLEDRLNQETDVLMLGDIFSETASYLKWYTLYVNNYNQSLELFEKKKKSDNRFRLFVLNAERNTKGATTQDLLISVIQRIPRYVLLLSDFIKQTPTDHEDFQTLEVALSQIRSVAEFINTEKKTYDNSKYAEKIHKDLTLEMKEDRTFVYEEEVWKEPYPGPRALKSFKIIFLSDIVLFVKLKEGQYINVKKINFDRVRFRVFSQGNPSTFQFQGELFYALSEKKVEKLIETCKDLRIPVRVKT